MTLHGVEAVRVELSKTARKNTAVICKRATGQGMKEVWRIGKSGIFSETGAVRTNETSADMIRTDDTDLRNIVAISHIASLSALLHDIGKATDAFQDMLAGRIRSKNVYRHEWASLLMFCRFVETFSSPDSGDAGWLTALAEKAYDARDWIETNPENWNKEGETAAPFRRLTNQPLATLIGYIIVSHHRMPLRCGADCQALMRAIKNGANEITAEWNERYINEAPNDAVAEKYRTISAGTEKLPMSSDGWRSRAAYDAGYLLATGCHLSIADVAVTRLARLAMMAADHKVSADKTAGRLAIKVDPDTFPDKLYANTVAAAAMDKRKKTGTSYYGQGLTQHLLLVSRVAGKIAQSFSSDVPTLRTVPKSLSRRAGGRFEWQDNAADLAQAMREDHPEPGGFCICMASTGTGKTIGTAKIMNAWSGGLRLSYALGLRALTRQTGTAYIKDIGIGKSDVSVVIGGVNEAGSISSEAKTSASEGSESAGTLIDQMSEVETSGKAWQYERVPLFDAVLADRDDARIRNILAPPALICTIDHLMPASETVRGGDYIIPEIRIMTSDLILDEIDDYSPNDMPAIARLVYLAGVHGRKVILASATIPWAMSVGLFDAYRAGYATNIRSSEKTVSCLFVDEFNSVPAIISTTDEFAAKMDSFISGRRANLGAIECLHYARVARIDASRTTEAEKWKEAWVGRLKSACLDHHRHLAVSDPASGTRISVGLVKIAHVSALSEVVEALFDDTGWSDDVVVHVRPYHARYLLNHRSAIESMLDRVMSRREHAISPELSDIAKLEPGKTHLFLIVATSVCEVGRDWDADFAVIEPSSIRAIIQLAGRVQRHRRIHPGQDTANVSIMQFRYRQPKPDQREYDASVGGFERGGKDRIGRIILGSEDMAASLALEFENGSVGEAGLSKITAVPRLKNPENEEKMFASFQQFINEPSRSRGFRTMDAMESARIYSGFICPDAPAHIEKDDAWAFFSNIGTHMSGLFQHVQKFRAPLDGQRDVTLFKYNHDFWTIKPGFKPSRNGGWYEGYGCYVESPEKSAKTPDIENTNRVRKWDGDPISEPEQTPYDCARNAFLTFAVPSGSDEQFRYSKFLGLISI